MTGELHMPYHAMMRGGAVLGVVALALLAPASAATIIFTMSFISTHYVLAFIYSRQQLKQVFGNTYSSLTFIGLIVASILLYQAGLPAVLVFSAHHVFNEIYLLRRVVPLEDERDAKAFRLSSILLNFCIYFVVLRHNRHVAFMNVPFLWVALAAGYAAFFYFLWRLKKRLRASQLIDLCAFEVLGVLLVVASLYVRIEFLFLVFYHVLFWSVLPIPKFAKKGKGTLLRYGALTFAITAIILLLSPVGILKPSVYQLWANQFNFWTYMHIMVSLALSSAQPEWITRWFQPQYSPS